MKVHVEIKFEDEIEEYSRTSQFESDIRDALLNYFNGPSLPQNSLRITVREITPNEPSVRNPEAVKKG